jgi:mannose-1-phosphate guanylyltransferase
VIPAGGAGTRLWPLSRASSPKFLHDLAGTGTSLLRATVDRLTPLTGEDGVLIVTGAAHEEAVRGQLPELSSHAVLAEPSPRDSMAAIGLAAAVLAEREGDVVLGSFAADHVIRGAGFTDAVHRGVAAARAGYVCTIGIEPTFASTAFGYIETAEGPGNELAETPGVHHVQGFTEKPDAVTAEQWIASGRYQWNAGVFLVRTEVLLGHLARLLPVLHDGLREIARAWDTPRRAEVMSEIWPSLQRIAIDHAIAEPVAAAGGVAVVPGDFEWDDVGDVAAVRDLVPGEPHVLGAEEDVLALESPGALVAARSGRMVVVLGVPDAVVLDTPDALLVTTRDQAQQVKRVVGALRERGRTALL